MMRIYFKSTLPSPCLGLKPYTPYPVISVNYEMLCGSIRDQKEGLIDIDLQTLMADLPHGSEPFHIVQGLGDLCDMLVLKESDQ